MIDNRFAALAVVILLCAHGPLAHASGRADEHAPIGVMADHLHGEGEWMLSYRYMSMYMSDLRDGTSRVSKDETFAKGYMVAPKNMKMEMHMAGAMYGASDDLTLMAMVPWTRISMDHKTGMGGTFKTRSESLGDIGLHGLYRLWRSEHGEGHLNLGMNLPTGSIDEKDDTPMGRSRLPYPMQIGTGSFAVVPGLTYNDRRDGWSWGAQALFTFQLNENRHDYRDSHRGEVSIWGSKLWTERLSTSLRVRGSGWGNIRGSDPRLNPAVVPTADPDLQAGYRVDIGLGANWLFTDGPLKNHRLAAELLLPTYQWLDGPQLEMDWAFVLGWQRAF